MHQPSEKWSRFLPWLFFSCLGIVILVLPLRVQGQAPEEHIFRVEASQFSYTPANLKVSPGDRVTIELTAQDVVHGLAIDGYNLEISADPGQTARLQFTADRRGTFRLRCSVTCGALHPFMIGKLQVGDDSLLWRAAGLSVLMVVAGIWRELR